MPPAAYHRVFRLLWALKHAEHALSSAWAALNDAQRALNALRATEREHGVEVAGAEKARPPPHLPLPLPAAALHRRALPPPAWLWPFLAH